MNNLIVPAVALTAALVALPSSAALPVTHGTPNSCVERNGGDWIACNAGSTGRGDLRYPKVSPDRCITLNGGDWTACNVGNGQRGDLPFG